MLRETHDGDKPRSHGRLRPVILPHGAERFAHAAYFTGVQPCFHRLPGSLQVRGYAVPYPASPGKNHLIRQLSVHAQIRFIKRTIRVIIVPVYQRHIFRRLHRLRQIRIQGNIIVIIVRRTHPQIHVAPNHRGQAQFPANLRHPFQMGGHDFCLGMVSVFMKIIAQSQRPRFIHPKMDPFGQKRFRGIADTRFHKTIDFLFSHHEDIIRILHFAHGLPMQRVLEMGQRLYTGNHLNAKLIRIAGQSMQFLFCKPAPESPEIRVFRHFISIFRIQHERIHSQAGQ